MTVTMDQFMSWSPAWLQAGVAAVTIYGGSRMLRKQAEAQRQLELQRERRQDIRHLQAAAQAAAISHSVWDTARHIAERQDRVGAQSLLATVDDLKQLLTALPIAELNHPTGITILHMQITSCGQMAILARALASDNRITQDYWGQVVEMATATARDAKALETWALEQLGTLRIKEAKAEREAAKLR
ncbi:hypothetical protein ABIC63_002758 [Pseudacidovorax sp. 1753]|uniref:hypothetical protein n=1 Tax=Pseudacidovorax sp. 1753 TaxID=3156419 RepID=UPI0033936D57